MVKSVGYTMRRQNAKVGLMSRMKEYASVPRRRFVILLLCSVTLVVLVVAYIIFSVTSWRSFEAQAGKTHQATKDAIARLERTPQQIKEVAKVTKESRATIAQMCNISPLIQWQASIFPRAKQAVGKCLARQEKLEGAQDVLREIHARIQSEQNFANLMNEARQALSTLEATEFEARGAQWQKTQALLTEMKTHKSLASTRSVALTATEEIIAAYRALAAAHTAEDRQAFDDATAAHAKSYSKLGAIQNHSVDSYDALIDDLSNELRQL